MTIAVIEEKIKRPLHQVNRQVFFELLHTARYLKSQQKFPPFMRKTYLLGMIRMFYFHIEDIKAGQNIQDYWKHQCSEAM